MGLFLADFGLGIGRSVLENVFKEILDLGEVAGTRDEHVSTVGTSWIHEQASRAIIKDSGSDVVLVDVFGKAPELSHIN